MKTSAVLILLILAPSVLAAETSPLPRFTDPARRSKLEAAFPEIDAIFELFWRDSGAPGLVFGVVIDSDLAHVKSYGVGNRGTKEPVTPATVFRIASMTKSFTALAILKLRDEEKLSLDDPAERWIPELRGLPYPTRDSGTDDTPRSAVTPRGAHGVARRRSTTHRRRRRLPGRVVPYRLLRGDRRTLPRA